MRRLIAALLRLVLPARRPQHSSGDVHWQVPVSVGLHSARCPRFTVPPPPPPSPVVGVYLLRDEWLKISAALTWNSELPPAFVLLQSGIINAIALSDPVLDHATQWDLGRTDDLWGNHGR
jgi:hypothetical protein